jgi:hypothetical protein
MMENNMSKSIDLHMLYAYASGMIKEKTVITISIITGVLVLALLLVISTFGFPFSRVNFFPTRAEISETYFDSAIRGRLVIIDGCICLRPLSHGLGFFGTGEMVIWPHGYSVIRRGLVTSVLDQRGHIVARVGSWIILGGGETTKEWAEKLVKQPIPERYNGLFWLAAPIKAD